MSEADVIVAWIEIYGFIALKCLWDKGLTKYTNCYKQERFCNAELLCKEAVTSRKEYAMQNCFVKKQKSTTFLSRHFNSSLMICYTIFFADNKVNSIHLS
jgi:hypothetical protein